VDLDWIWEKQIFHHDQYLLIVATIRQASQDLDLDLFITAIVQIVLRTSKAAQKLPIQRLIRPTVLIVTILLMDLSYHRHHL
jgi:hypothetical protein